MIRDYIQQNPHYKRLKNMAHIHNQFLQTFAMSGLIGLFSFLAFLLVPQLFDAASQLGPLPLCRVQLFNRHIVVEYITLERVQIDVQDTSTTGFIFLVA